MSQEQHPVPPMNGIEPRFDDVDDGRSCADSIDSDLKTKPTNTLGSVQLRNPITNDIILVPTPSNDPNDPLNWSRGYRIYIALISCAAIFMAQFLAAGPSVDMIGIVEDIFGISPSDPGYSSSLAKMSYAFSGASLAQGMSNLIYMPLIIKYGRRPVYIISFLIYGGCALWAGLAKGYSSELAARLIMGFAGGSAECVAPLTIADTFFLHERGLIMSYYSAALSCGVSGGIILSGLITIHQSWRVIYYVAAGMIWTLVLLIIFTMPETAYQRKIPDLPEEPNKASDEPHAIHRETAIPPKKSYSQRMRLLNPAFTQESLFTLFWRPVPLLFLPSVLWGTLAMSVAIGTFVAICSNFATAFTTTYNWSTWQCGLTYMPFSLEPPLRRDGIREPEMRLPTVTISLILCPVSLILYGVGIQKSLHWIVPVIGLGLLGFVITQVSNVALVYAIDAHRPIAGEVVVSQLSFKAAFGFLLSFYTNPWIDSSGYINAFGSLAGICAAVLIMWIPLYLWGRQIRVWSLGLWIMKGVRWESDREVGE
ncbi:hypothetical protein N7478_000956 [Penicillium angulare]|uniref:uncharacterized protein n=1 Tax=Penicillium angulare TaxID=116970 RepID=UPI002540BC4C|nr:uncharacterized protein N7478_000956 [Penicillium angulare]KAJ5291705.1 hypothetical protein N7478_000956 [Penicillium angulare]